MKSTLRLSPNVRAFQGSALLALLVTMILMACSAEDGPVPGGAGSNAAGTPGNAGGPGAAGTASTGGVVSTGGVSGVAGSAGGSVASTAGTGTVGGGGQATAGNGSMAGTSSGGSVSSGGAGGSGGASTGRSNGCGKTSTVTFGSAPNGTGAGGSAKIGNRNFIVRLPDNYDKDKPYWLIFGFHWRGGSANDVDSGGSNKYNMAHYGLQKLSKNGAIFVAADGLGGGWANNGGEDLKFVDDMVKLIQDNYCVDTKHLFANGFSYGGGMSYALACARADVFKAVAIYDGAVLSGCEGGTKPIAYWQMHGLTDGTLGIGPARMMRDQFVKNNGCTAQTPPEPPQPPPYLVNGGHICTNYSGCSSGHPVRWCAHQSGHGNAIVDGTDDLFHRCANPGMTCSDSCRCSWVPEDVWTFFNSL